MTLQDVGTRYTHYTELLDLWYEGLAILERRKEEFPGFFDGGDKAKLAGLQAATEILQKQIDILATYEPAFNGRKEIEEAHDWYRSISEKSKSGTKPKN